MTRTSGTATALVLVDVQRNLVEGPHAVPAAPALRVGLDTLLRRARAAGAVVVHVQHEGPPGSPDEPGTPGWELHHPPAPGELLVRCGVRDAFEATPELARSLTARAVDRVVVAGVQSEHCVAATCRGARAQGFRVELAAGLHATYDSATFAAEIESGVEKALEAEGVVLTPGTRVVF
ncbi:isochorismatase family protein [Kineococcus gynurae]|uniref:Isochorismatase family protein n=1 Tax=Kineococcus gynurae TaxID=452979 RepID=A0ABV5LW43_9ACTN